jgi:hypothetical protein
LVIPIYWVAYIALKWLRHSSNQRSASGSWFTPYIKFYVFFTPDRTTTHEDNSFYLNANIAPTPPVICQAKRKKERKYGNCLIITATPNDHPRVFKNEKNKKKK